ncbi:MAG: hypothetical protein J6T10_21920 [Methanobrevibacter sp.]|nr:hypothetical protein [Methanobrevibacter sp.]
MIYYKKYSYHESKIIGKRNKKIDNNIYSFDIETTSYLKLDGKIYNASYYENLTKKEKERIEYYSIMYIWMFSINDIVYYGRTWKDLKEFLELLAENIPEKKIVFVHNLSYEFQFLRGVFDFRNVFARTQRKVMKCFLPYYNIEFHCTYFMTNIGLDKLANTFKLPVKKLVGNLDYDIIRVPTTKLTSKELAYCENDCLILYHYIKLELETYLQVNKIPITSTGKVRRELSDLVYKDIGYRRNMRKSINTDPHIYNLLLESYQGGYTHANWIYTDEILENVDSYDFTSSYPYVMVAYKYPATEFIKDNVKTVDDMYRLYAYLLVVRFKNLKCRYYNNFISSSKCRYIKGGKYDNGRLMSADEIEIVLTDVDFKFILKAYSCEYEIIESYSALYKYLPKLLINFILDKYVKKTELKGIESEEVNYNRVKAMFNSIYGMTCTNTIRNDVLYDNVKGWYEEELTNEKILELLEKERKKGFLSFSIGVWVTAYARNNLLSNLIKLDSHQVYADTDSLKLLNGYDKNIIDNYNKEVVERIEYVSKMLNIPIEKYSPKDIKGEKHLLGVFECETKKGDLFTYKRFITQGAKKYAVEDFSGNIKITVAGVPKKEGAKCLSKLEDFRDNLVFKSSITDKQTIVYLDEQLENELVDYQGNKYNNTDKTGACLIPCSYELGKSIEYANLISDESSKRAIYMEEIKNE